MSYVVYAAIAIALAVVLPRLLPGRFDPAVRQSLTVAGRTILSLLAVLFVLATSIVRVPADKVGIVHKLYGTKNLAENRIIATDGETGYQAGIVPPGAWRVSLLFNVFNAVTTVPLVTVPQGFYGRIVARDGANLRYDQVMADAWPEKDFQSFIEAEYFLRHGGQKGLQLSVLKPGTYALNLALFEVRIGYEPNGRDVTTRQDDVYNIDGLSRIDSPLTTEITRVPAGSVGVVRSAVQEPGKDCTPITAKVDVDGLVAELVAAGCKGVWATSLPPNDYYLNRDAYSVTLVSTRVTTLNFKGGFQKRFIKLAVDSKGDFVQQESSVDQRDIGDDRAINTIVEGWQVPTELRAVVQIAPERAPIVVASVGGQAEVEERIIIPAIRSHVRNVFGGQITVATSQADGTTRTFTRPTTVADTVEQRPALEAAILALAKEDGRRAGVDVKEIRLGETAIPPELLLARQRQQLATQLKAAFEQEREAQTQRQATEQARATADQQKDLVAAQIGVKSAQLLQDKRAAEGRGERLFLEEQAAGQRAQTDVLGRESVMRLQTFKLILDALTAHPEIVRNLQLPRVYVSGGSGGLEGAAAVLSDVLNPSGTAASDTKR